MFYNWSQQVISEIHLYIKIRQLRNFNIDYSIIRLRNVYLYNEFPNKTENVQLWT